MHWHLPKVLPCLNAARRAGIDSRPSRTSLDKRGKQMDIRMNESWDLNLKLLLQTSVQKIIWIQVKPPDAKMMLMCD